MVDIILMYNSTANRDSKSHEVIGFTIRFIIIMTSLIRILIIVRVHRIIRILTIQSLPRIPPGRGHVL